MENKWLTIEDVSELFPMLTRNAQAKARHYRQLTYTKCAGKVIYKPEWIDEYINRGIVKAAS